MVGIKVQVFMGVLISYAAFLVLVSSAPSQLGTDGFNYPEGLRLEHLGMANKKDFFLGANLTMPWMNASRFCRDSGLRLATIESQEEWDLLDRTIVPYGVAFKCWTSGIEKRQPSLLHWDETRGPVNTTFFRRLWWGTELTHCLATIVIDVRGGGRDILDGYVSNCSAEHPILCELVN